MMVVVQVMVMAAMLCVGSTQTEEILELKFRLKVLEENTQKQLYELKSKLDLLQTENSDLRTMVETMQKKNETKNVAFSASLLTEGSRHIGPFTKVESPLIYQKVVSNFGNGYNSETGIFTAPVKGVYYFRFYAHSQAGILMAVSLYKNDIRQSSVYHARPYTSSNGSNGIVLSLEVGDEIYTKLWDGARVYDDPGSYTSFGGFLLFPL